MTYLSSVPLDTIVGRLRAALPGLTHMLAEGVDPETLEPTVEMVSALLIRYDAGEIADVRAGGGAAATARAIQTVPPRNAGRGPRAVGR